MKKKLFREDGSPRLRKFVLSMKLTMIFLIVSIIQIQASVYSQNSKLSVDVKDQTVREVLKQIEDVSDYRFFYSENLLDLNDKVTIDMKEKSIEKILDALFENQNLKYEINENNLIVLRPINMPQAESEITGTVVDRNGVPLPGVTVLIKGTAKGTITDDNGKYVINAPVGTTLVFSFVGMKLVEVEVKTDRVINVTLEDETVGIEEVVAVGYGTQKKANVTGSIATVKMEDVVKTPTSNVKNLLIGQVPGMITNQNPGLPGSENVDINIRGFAAPLTIVDGVESYLDRIDPNDIESITVLKDASAAIYGTRGGNGVILVNTKRGAKGKSKINYHGWYGAQFEVALPDFANAADFVQARRDATFNTFYDPNNPDAVIDYSAQFTSEEELELYKTGQLPSYDWKRGLIRQKGARVSNHNVSVTGGNDKLSHYTSVGLMHQNGILKGDYDYNKLTLTHNMDAKITDHLTMALNASYINEVRDYASGAIDALLNDLRTSKPFYNYELPDPDKVAYSGFSERSIIGRMYKKFAGYDLQKQGTGAAAIDLKYDAPFLKGLSMGVKVNGRFRNLYEEKLSKPYLVYSYNPDRSDVEEERYILEGTQSLNEFYKYYVAGTNDPKSRILSRYYAQYNLNFGKHEFETLAFFEKENNTYNGLGALRLNNLAPDVPQITGENSLTQTFGYGRGVEYTRISYAGRINYNYDNKYLLEATLRADASSKFGPENRWGYFPSVSVGWNMHREAFLMNNNVINTMKLRLSYSQSGIDSNVGATSFEYLTGFEQASSAIYILDGQNVPIIVSSGLANPLISWENVTMYNGGLDFTLFQNKLYGEFDVFYRKRTGLLGTDSEAVSSIFGATLPLVNINSRDNRGFEVALGYKNNIGEFQYSVKGNLGYSREKYVHQEEDINPDDPYDVKYRQLTGNWVNRWFGYKTDGLFNSQAEVDEYLATYTFADISGTPKPGDIKYIDVNGDKIIDRNDRELIGRGTLPNLTYAIQTNFRYKNWTLTTDWQGSSLFNINVGGHMRAPFTTEQVPLTFHTKYAWRQDPENPGVSANPNAKIPAYNISGPRSWNNVDSDFWLQDGTYIRLKTATLTYQLPENLSGKAGMSNIEVYLSGDNLTTFSRLGIYKEDNDPEQASSAQGWGLPLNRTVTAGIRIGL